MITPSPSSAKKKSKFSRIGLSRTLSRDKAACEFYKEDEHLAEGDLPSLGGGTSIPYMRPSAIHSSDELHKAMVVTPTSRSSTPVVKNKSQKQQQQQQQKKGRRLFQRRKEENVTIEAPMLSPETKRKHKVFWSQMDVKDDYTSDDNSSPAFQQEEMPDDELRDLALERQKVNLERNVEQVEYDAPGPSHDIITILTDMCSDCGWTKLTNGQDNTNSSDGIKPDYVRENARAFHDEDHVESESYPVDRTRAIFDQDEVISTHEEEESLPSKATMESSSPVRSKTAYHTDAYENTAIEVEYYDAGVPDDEIDHDPPPYDGFLQLDNSGDVSAFVRPNDRAMSDVNGYSNSVGDVGYPLSKSRTWAAPDRNAYLQAMAKKAKEDFIRKRAAEQERTLQESKSLDGGRNNDKKQIQDLASNDQTSESIKYKYSSPSGVEKFPHGEVSSTFSNEVSMDVPSDVGPRNTMPLGLKKVKSEIPQSSTKTVVVHTRKPKFSKFGSDSPKMLANSKGTEIMHAPYEIESKGSILSVGRKKKVKNGQFFEINDESDSEVNKSTESAPRSSRIGTNERPDDDIFDFEDNIQTPSRDPNAPFSTIKLDPKEDSCDVSLLGSLAGNGDGGTVFSSRSMYTAGTNATNWSTSTRRRHRGAAKQRLSETKAENQRPSGWLESIKAAAEKNNCRWDPKHGWIDYVEPTKDEERDGAKQPNQRIGRLKTPKFQGARKSKRSDDESSCDESQLCSTEVPFPSKWERAREDMIRNGDGAASAVTEVASNKILKPTERRQNAPLSGTGTQLELGAAETIVEDAEENADSDNRSDSQSVPDVSGSSNSSNDKESTEIPEKGKLFEWVGKIDQNYNAINIVGGKQSEKNVSDRNNDALEMIISVPDASGNVKNASQETDADDFGQNSGSFDFSATDSAKDATEDVIDTIEDDGFKVIKDSKGMGFEQKKKKSSHISQELNEVGEQMSGLAEKYQFKRDKTSFGGSRSVMSSNSVSSKAKDWLEKIEKNKNQNVKPKDGMERSKSSQSALFVSAVDDDSIFEYQGNKGNTGDQDTIFNLNESSNSKVYTRKGGEKAAPHFVKSITKTSSHNESVSGMTSSADISEAGNTNSNRYGSFFSRLQACTSPMFEDDDRVRSMPQAHLAFMKKSAESQDSRLMNMIKNQTLCGDTNNVDEPVKSGLPPRTPSNVGSGTQGRSNVASNYLQAIKERSRNGSNFENGDSEELKRTNSILSTSSSNSESWQKFLEKRNKALASSISTKSDHSNNSKAAEEYARSKVQEVIKRISKDKTTTGEHLDTSRRTQSAARIRPPSNSSSSTLLPPRSSSAGRIRQSPYSQIPSVNRNSNKTNDAEDLAAAKVEAMMNVISDTSMEGEI